MRVNDVLELPDLKLQRKVKGMQMFRAPVAACGQGDRVGICVTQVEAKLIERGVACSPGAPLRWLHGMDPVSALRNSF